MVEVQVSVVIPAYNCAAFIETTLATVSAQRIEALEIVVVDDASTDATVEVLERLAASEPRLVILKQAVNSGQGACRNLGVRSARGRYIAFLDSDDIWLPEKLERQLQFLRERELAFCFCGYGTIDEHGDPIIADLKIPAVTDYHALLRSNTICPSSVVYDRERMDDIRMPERPVRREDLISWLEVSRRLGDALYGIPQPLCMVRRLRGSSSSNKLKTLGWQWRVYRDYAGFGPLRALGYLAVFALTSLAKRSSATVAVKRHMK